MLATFPLHTTPRNSDNRGRSRGKHTLNLAQAGNEFFYFRVALQT